MKLSNEEFYKNIAYFNRRIDFCNSIVLLNEIFCIFQAYTKQFFLDDELHKMQIPFENDFAAVRMRIYEKYDELRKENEYEEIED